MDKQTGAVTVTLTASSHSSASCDTHAPTHGLFISISVNYHALHSVTDYCQLTSIIISYFRPARDSLTQRVLDILDISVRRIYYNVNLKLNYIYTHTHDGGADKSLARPTFRCRRTESIVSLERGVYSCAELQIFSCYRG